MNPTVSSKNNIKDRTGTNVKIITPSAQISNNDFGK
jgi:hypothetical protein